MPNLVFMMSDEARKDVVFHDKYPFVRTPNIDSLRGEAVSFHHCFANYAVCVPSRSSMITGRYPHQIGVLRNSHRLPADERDLGHHLSAHGFDCVSACRQFDDYLRGRAGGAPFAAFVGIYAPHPPLYPPREYAGLYSADEIALPPLPAARDNAARPSIQTVPRRRWNAYPDATRREVIASYLALITLLDDCVGRILTTLRATATLDDTLVCWCPITATSSASTAWPARWAISTTRRSGCRW